MGQGYSAAPWVYLLSFPMTILPLLLFKIKLIIRGSICVWIWCTHITFSCNKYFDEDLENRNYVMFFISYKSIC